MSSIFLVGMMGAGKSTIGRLLGKRLNLDFIDADRELEARSGVTIATIFELEGEEGFRRREMALLEELTERSDIVLATGGGAVLYEENRAHLAQRGLVIYLRASAEEILRRTQKDKSRPLLQTDNRRGRIESLLATREPLYQSIAHIVVQSSPGNPARLIDRLLSDERLVERLHPPTSE